MKKKEHQNSGTLGKDTINKWIISFLSVEKRRFSFNNGEQPDVYFDEELYKIMFNEQVLVAYPSLNLRSTFAQPSLSLICGLRLKTNS